MADSEDWFTEYGSIKTERIDEFSDLATGIVGILRKLEGRVSYKEMYQIVLQAGTLAVENMVREHMNRNPGPRR